MSYFQVEEVISVESLSKAKKNDETEKLEDFGDESLALCPVCKKKSLRVENGCNTCINPECGFSKCDT